ncbi:MAG: hypothetical protein JJE22_02295 [Bacteroidia bacterium]|nr:hypothetical protein [Bacteroidia bacterium]
MNINNIKLPAFVIADLYQSSLIEADETTLGIQTEAIIPEIKISDTADTNSGLKWLGENRKNILIIARYSDVVHLPDSEFNFLIGILGACNLNIGDVAFLNLNNHFGITYAELATHFESKIIFLFGVEPTVLGLPISFPHFQVQSFANSSFLFSPALNELESDKVLKSKLWVCLQRIFNL